MPKLKIGYFHQGFEQLDLNKTVLQNAISDSVQSESVVRSVLARMLFTNKGTVIFVSHDSMFISSVSTCIFTIQDKKIVAFT